MLLKPDRMNGQEIYRGVTMGADGVNHQNEMILFPPKIITKHGPVKPLAELVAEAQSKFVIVGDRAGALGDALQKATHKLVAFYMKRAALNERERIRLALEKHGFKEAQHAMMDQSDG